jgi:hypothetical protein
MIGGVKENNSAKIPAAVPLRPRRISPEVTRLSEVRILRLVAWPQ